MEAPSPKFLEKSVVRTLGLLHSRKMVAGGGTAIMLHVSYSARSRNAAILCRVYFLGDTHQKKRQLCRAFGDGNLSLSQSESVSKIVFS